MMGVGEYIRAAMMRPWAWGKHDCCTFVASWVIACGHADPMAFIRGDYSNEKEALRRISRGGGLVALWTRGMIDAGVPEADEARAGDVGVIRCPTPCGSGEAASIFTGDRWITLGVRGIDSGPADVLAIWRP
jgi:hypothetical protein